MRAESTPSAERPREPDPAPDPPERRRWDEAPLRHKTTLLVLLALVIGALAGQIDVRMGDRLWPLAGVLVLIALVLVALGRCWIEAPLVRLIHYLDVQSRGTSPGSLKKLPVTRRDEIGHLARSAHRLCAAAIRHRHESTRLRRTFDRRVQTQTERACDRLRRAAMRDDLTSLGNRRFLDEQLEALIGAARESGTPLVCLVIDVDRFKRVNDTLGHAAGDHLIVRLATLIRGSARHDDIAVRLGGDEFVLFMPGMETPDAIRFADMLRKLFHQQIALMPGAAGLNVDLSIGVAELFADRCDTGRKLIEAADHRLYAAKRAGRGRTVADGGGRNAA